MTKVVQLHQHNNTSYTMDEHVLRDIRILMYEWSPKDLAEEIGCSVACIYAIRSGRTRWPRGKTLFGILRALDLELHIYSTRERRYL